MKDNQLTITEDTSNDYEGRWVKIGDFVELPLESQEPRIQTTIEVID